jgi:hypothetical protein
MSTIHKRILILIKPRERDVACVREMRNAFEILVGNPEG